MAYKIDYSPETAHLYPSMEKGRNRKNRKWIVLLLILALLTWVRVKGIPDFLIPGDKEVTKYAANVLIENLRDGKKLEEAVTVFCKIILNGQQL